MAKDSTLYTVGVPSVKDFASMRTDKELLFSFVLRLEKTLRLVFLIQSRLCIFKVNVNRYRVATV